MLAKQDLSEHPGRYSTPKDIAGEMLNELPFGVGSQGIKTIS